MQVFGANVTVAVTTKKAIHDVIARLAHHSPPVPATSAPAEPKPAAARPEDRVASFVSTLLSDALREQVSDIHLEPLQDRLRIRFRRDGVLSLYKEQRKELAMPLTNYLKGLARLTPVEPRRHQEGRIRCEDRQHSLAVDVQASFSVTMHGEKIVLRLQNRKSQLPALDALGMLPPMLTRFRSEALDTTAGAVLITGPAGAGKTVTLYSCLSYLNNTAASIITVEEPAEYVIDGMAQCVVTPQSGLTWDETLRHVVGQDADVIALSELRNRATAEIALQAALSGRKVLTTIHGGESLDGVLRLLHLGIDRSLIALTVRCVVAQRLLRRICPGCAEPYVPTADEVQRLGYSRQEAEGLQGKIGRGCEQCRATGYRGRIGIYELLCVDEQVQDALLAGNPTSELRRLSLASSGLGTLIEDGILKAVRGITSFQEVLRCLPRLRKPRPWRELQRLVDEA
jgi:type IV pilus assembly protein PilB